MFSYIFYYHYGGSSISIILSHRDRSRDRDRRRDRSRSRERYGGAGTRKTGNPGACLRKPKWDLSRLEPFKKDFYTPHPNVKNRSESEIEQWRLDKDITLKGRDIPAPVLTFDEANFPEYVMSEIDKVGFDKPTGNKLLTS